MSGCGGGAGSGCSPIVDCEGPAAIAGGGGGAGGALVLEAPRVALSDGAEVYAVGGAGGSPAGPGGSSENNAGCEEENPGYPHWGAGAGQPPVGYGDAGSGAQLGLDPQGCGGGGGFGWIRINAGGAPAMAQTAVLNPGAGSGAMTTGLLP